MKILVIIIALLSFQRTIAQSYEELMELAGTQIKLERYKDALQTFQRAFKNQAEIGKYDYANASVAALRSGQSNLAIEWLAKGAKIGLGNSQEELFYFKNDSIFKTIINDDSYRKVLSKMESQLLEKNKLDSTWQYEILSNAISKGKGSYQNATPGFALYYVNEGGLEIPYIVFIPGNYNPKKPTRAVFFLHGGVITGEASFRIDPQTRLEPIFTIGDSTGSIIIYPFQKGNPGWKDYTHCSSVIAKILTEVKARYSVDINTIYLGGLSMGGNVSYQFARGSGSPFRAFYAISAKPKFADFESGGSLVVTRPIYSLHAKDDSLYTYENLKNVYQQAKRYPLRWYLTTVETGGHGFPYHPAGRQPTLKFFRDMFLTEEGAGHCPPDLAFYVKRA